MEALSCSEMIAECGLWWPHQDLDANNPVKPAAQFLRSRSEFNTCFTSVGTHYIRFLSSFPHAFLSFRCTWPWSSGPKGPVWWSPLCAWFCCPWLCWSGSWEWRSTGTTGTTWWLDSSREEPSLPSWWEERNEGKDAGDFNPHIHSAKLWGLVGSHELEMAALWRGFGE